MPNDGIKNEIKIVEAYNNKTVESLTDKQQKIICQIEDTVCLLYTSPSPRD